MKCDWRIVDPWRKRKWDKFQLPLLFSCISVTAFAPHCALVWVHDHQGYQPSTHLTHSLSTLWGRALKIVTAWRRKPVVRIKAGKMLTCSCCGQNRLNLEKFRLILLVCCVNTFPSSDWPSSHTFFCSLQLSISGVLCPFLNTPSKRSILLPPLQLLLSTPGHLHLAQESDLSISLPGTGTCDCTMLPIWNWAEFCFGSTASCTYPFFFCFP